MRRLLFALALLAAPLSRAEESASKTDSETVVATALPEPPMEAGAVPLSEPIAPVPGAPSPWSVGAGFAAGIADPFYSKVTLGLDVRRVFGAASLELFGAHAFSWGSPALSLCSPGVGCTAPSTGRLTATPGDLSWVAGAGGALRFAVGKASVAGRTPFGFGLEARLGAAAVMWSVSDPIPRDSWSPGVRAGLGLVGSAGTALDARVGLDLLAYTTDVRGVSAFERQWLAGVSLAWRPGGVP